MSNESEINTWIKTSNLCAVLVKSHINDDMFYRVAHKIKNEEGVSYIDALTLVELNNTKGLEVLDEENIIFTDDYLSLSDLIISQGNVTDLYDSKIETNLKRTRKKY